MSYLAGLLTQKEPLESHEVKHLKAWLRELKLECRAFGATSEDVRAALSKAIPGDTQ